VPPIKNILAAISRDCRAVAFDIGQINQPGRLTFAKLLAFGARYSQRRGIVIIVAVAPRLSEGMEPE
jgi:spore germination protein YaaH